MRAPPEHETTTDEAIFHGRQNDRNAVHVSFYIDDRLPDSHLLRQGRQAFFVRLGGIEIERIGGIKRRVVLDPAGIHQKVNAIVGANLVVVVALWTDLKVPFEIFLPKRILAAVALDPQSFRKNAALIRSFYRLLLALEPGHKRVIIAAAGAGRFFAAEQDQRPDLETRLDFPLITLSRHWRPR